MKKRGVTRISEATFEWVTELVIEEGGMTAAEVVAATGLHQTAALQCLRMLLALRWGYIKAWRGTRGKGGRLGRVVAFGFNKKDVPHPSPEALRTGVNQRYWKKNKAIVKLRQKSARGELNVFSSLMPGVL